MSHGPVCVNHGIVKLITTCVAFIVSRQKWRLNTLGRSGTSKNSKILEHPPSYWLLSHPVHFMISDSGLNFNNSYSSFLCTGTWQKRTSFKMRDQRKDNAGEIG